MFRNTGRTTRSAIALLLALPLAPCFAADNDLQQMLIEATSLAGSGDTEQAKSLYRDLIDNHPGTVYAGHAHLGMATLHIAAREDEEAVAELDLALAYPSTGLVSKAAVQKMEEYGTVALLASDAGLPPRRFSATPESPAALLARHEAPEWLPYAGGVLLPSRYVSEYSDGPEEGQKTTLTFSYVAVNQGATVEALTAPLPATLP